ncbi:hypothetical protein [Streptomyces sp. NPDC051657]|uniref:hypothetical protein n=1 Tax=unclassified Streptomyces TaxID=2593676 RepID=UPI00341FBA16
MISARLRYAALSAAATVALMGGLLWAQAGIWPGAVMCLLLTAGCLLSRGRVRATAAQRQDEQARELAQLTAETWAEPWATWCCELGWLTRGNDHQADRCTRAQQR